MGQCDRGDLTYEHLIDGKAARHDDASVPGMRTSSGRDAINHIEYRPASIGHKVNRSPFRTYWASADRRLPLFDQPVARKASRPYSGESTLFPACRWGRLALRNGVPGGALQRWHDQVYRHYGLISSRPFVAASSDHLSERSASARTRGSRG